MRTNSRPIHPRANIEPVLGIEDDQAAQVRRCAGATLTLALQSAFPQYPMTAHKKAGEQMEKDMKYNAKGPILSPRPKPDFTTDGENARLAKTITILMDANDELLAACKEMLNHIDPWPNDEPLSSRCRVCNRHPTKHDKDCVVLTARAAIAKARKGGV